MNVYTHVIPTEDQRAAVGLVGGLLDRSPIGDDVCRRRSDLLLLAVENGHASEEDGARCIAAMCDVIDQERSK